MNSQSHHRILDSNHLLLLELQRTGVAKKWPQSAPAANLVGLLVVAIVPALHKTSSSQARARNRRWSWKNRSIVVADVCLAQFIGPQLSLANAWKQGFVLSLPVSQRSKTAVKPLANNIEGGKGLSSCASTDAEATQCPLRRFRDCQSVVKPVGSLGNTCFRLPVGPAGQWCRFLLIQLSQS